MAVCIFALAVFESFICLIGKGALEWGPAKQIKPDDEMTSQTRNTLNTVRRIGVRKVGQEGRLSAEENIQKEEAGN